MNFIRVRGGPNNLRWGFSNRGSFSIKESYNIRIGNQEEEDGIWRKLGNTNPWPKVAIFT